MPKLSRKTLYTVLIMMSCVVVIQAVRWIVRRPVDPAAVSAVGRTKGDPGAEIQIIEYIDFRCGPCAYGTQWLKDFMEQHPGKIQLEVRYFPLNLSRGIFEPRLTECAAQQGKFWEVFDALMSRQKEWIRLQDPTSFQLAIAREFHLDMDRLDVCLEDPEIYDHVLAIKDSGRQMGVNATPTYFINHQMAVGVNNLQAMLGTLLGLPVEGDAHHENLH